MDALKRGQPAEKIIFIPSCDKYADLWNPFFAFKEKFWPDATFQTFLSVNTKQYHHPGVSVIQTGSPSNWSDEMKIALEKIPGKYFLLILEDYFIYQQVDNSVVEKMMAIAEGENADFLRLGCFPGRYNSYWPYKPLTWYDDIAEINEGAKYRINLQTAIWRKEALTDLLVSGENPWQFEINASARANQKKFKSLCVIEEHGKAGIHGPIVYIGGAITKGKWMLDAIRLAKKNNIPLDISKRPVETKKEEALRKFYVSTPLFIRPAYRYMMNKLHVKW
jgi:hypothetical protein